MTPEYLPKLCIRSKEEYRMLLDLKRLYTLEVKAADKNLDRSKLLAYFSFHGARIYIEKDKIRVIKGSRLREFSLQEFSLKPRTVMGWVYKAVMN